MPGASEAQLEQKPAPGRLLFLRRHIGFLTLFALAAPLTFAFCWHPVIATLSDDSVSYLTLARYLSPFSGDALSDPWAKYTGHFPPLFPLLLVFTGSTRDLLAAHLVVAACALAAMPLAYRYASLRLGTPRAGLLATVLFMVLPSTWISIVGILSEPLFLALSLAALVLHERADDDQPGALHYVVLGLLFAAAYLTRAAGIALVAAYAVHMAIKALAGRRIPSLSSLLPIAVPLAFEAAWLALRPQPDHDSYLVASHGVVDRWLNDPQVLRSAWESFFGGWVASFTGDSAVGNAMRLAFGALGLLGVAGALAQAWRNRMDAWYLLAGLAILFAFAYPEKMMRRLMYPLLPLMLVHAAIALRAAWSAVMPRHEPRFLLAAWALCVSLVLPGSMLVAGRALDRRPLVPGFDNSGSSTTDYYTTINAQLARYAASQNAVALAGLELVDRTTPPGSRVMWTRPEYVAVLARRAAVPWYSQWDAATMARQVRESRTDYVVASRLYKSDLSGRSDDGFTPLVNAPPVYLHPALTLAGLASTTDFVLFEVDRAALDRYLAGVA